MRRGFRLHSPIPALNLVSVAFPVHHQIFKDYPAVKNALTTYLPDYEKAGDVYNQLAEHTAIAIQNAKRVEQYHLQNDSSKPFGIAVNPFTDIYQLVESLL